MPVTKSVILPIQHIGIVTFLVKVHNLIIVNGLTLNVFICIAIVCIFIDRMPITELLDFSSL